MRLKNIVVILGPPGSGKGTQGKLLASVLNYDYVSMGHILREYAESGSDLGNKIKELIDGGRYVPDEMARPIFHEVMAKSSVRTGLVLDGFPRDMAQAPIFEDAIKEFEIENVKVVFIEVPEEKLVQRLKLRGEKGSKRVDDNPEVFHVRFDLYRTKNFPLKDYFAKQGKLVEINGDQSVEEVHQEIKSKLGLS